MERYVMHMADALLSPSVGAVMYAAAVGAAAYSVRNARLDERPRAAAMMGVMGAFVFAVQMLNFAIPGTGSSGHLCGGVMLAALLGPPAAFLTMIGVLVVQCLLFADGGLLALGANIWNMAFYGCFIGGALVWRPMMRGGATKGRIAAASIVGCVATLQLGALSVTLETLASGVTQLPFFVFVGAMQPIHLAIGAVEGVITAAVLTFIWSARPELLWGVGARASGGRLSLGATIAALAAAALVSGGVISHFASESPDGLEWSVERTAGTAELEAEGSVHESMERVQSATAILPDYAIQGDESPLGTSVSGILGGLAVAALCFAVCKGALAAARGRSRAA